MNFVEFHFEDSIFGYFELFLEFIVFFTLKKIISAVYIMKCNQRSLCSLVLATRTSKIIGGPAFQTVLENTISCELKEKRKIKKENNIALHAFEMHKTNLKAISTSSKKKATTFKHH